MLSIKYPNIAPDHVLPGIDTLSKLVGNGFRKIISEILIESTNVINIEAGYKTMEIEVLEDRISGNGFEFVTGKTIAKQLKGSSQAAVFIVTLGSSFDIWSRNFFSSNDPVRGYIADKVGSLAAENAAGRLHDQIEIECKARELNCTNRFSPGYCGWDVADQNILFDLLPENFCGVKFNASSLMEPLKSISGIVGIGKYVDRSEYPCSDCEMQDCLNRDQENNYA